MHLSIIIPAYNEAERIGNTLKAISDYLRKQPYDYEILVVNDGSNDETAESVQSLIGQISHIRLIDNKENRGKGAVVRQGMLEARGDFRLFVDADNAISMEQIENFWPWLEKGYDVIIGSIEVPGAKIEEKAGWHRRILGKFSKYLIRILAIWEIRDTQRAFKLFPAQVAEAVFSRQTIEKWGFDIEVLVIAKKLGYKIKELPVTWINPAGSKVTLKSYLNTFIELLKIKWNLIVGRYSRQ